MTGAATQIIGRRVEAWTGQRVGQTGTVVRVHSRDWQIVAWDDGTEERYWVADLIRVGPGGEK